MAKNKQKGKKQKNVFQVANKHPKQKNKAKPVTTTLKHVRSFFMSFSYIYIVFSFVCSVFCTCSIILVASQINAVKNEKVENLNQIFTEVQRDVKSISKSAAPEPKKQTQVEFEKLWEFKTKIIIQCFDSPDVVNNCLFAFSRSSDSRQRSP